MAGTGRTQPSCENSHGCARLSASQLFQVADRLAANGDLQGAEQALGALSQDRDPLLRAEARFRLAAVREKRGDLRGAILALRELLEEKPEAQRARLELARLLAVQGDPADARRVLREASESGLPAEVAGVVDRYVDSLRAGDPRGGSMEVGFGYDSNVNRATNDKFIDTILAPFELDQNARGQAGMALAGSASAFSRDTAGKLTLLTRGYFRADIVPGKSHFNDVQLQAETGPEVQTGLGHVRPFLSFERRWFGNRGHSVGAAAALNVRLRTAPSSGAEVEFSIARQWIHDNDVLDGNRYAISASYERILAPRLSGRINLRAVRLDAVERAESIRLGGGEIILANDLPSGILFANFAFSRSWGPSRLELFGKTRSDQRADAGVGFLWRRTFAGFSPVVRATATHSSSNIELYDYRRFRIDVGVVRQF